MTSNSFIVCGWFTPDYDHWVPPLRERLDALGVAHDFVEVEPLPGGWERNTLRKPEQIRAAMDRHPIQTILFLDVDCQVCGTRDDLARLVEIPGDIGVYARTRIRSNGKPLFAPRSGTLVLRPTGRTTAFVDAWIDTSAKAPRFAVDQTTLVVALGRVPGLSVSLLGIEACATTAEIAACPKPIILHGRASEAVPRAGRLAKFAARFFPDARV